MDAEDRHATRRVDTLHVLLPAVVQMLVKLNVLKMVLVLLLGRECQLGALVQLLSIALTRNGHHHVLLVTCQHRLILHDAVVLSGGSILAVCRRDALAANRETLHIAALGLGTRMQVTVRHLVARIRSSQLADRAEA